MEERATGDIEKRQNRVFDSEYFMRRTHQTGTTMKVLIVEDLPSDVELVMREMRKLGVGITHEVVESRNAFLDSVAEFDPDIVLSDYSLPMFDGMTALKLLLERRPDIPFIIVTGSQNEEIAVECMKAGAADYMLKDNLRRLGPAVMAALEKYSLKREKENAEEAVRRSRDELEDIVKERTIELEERNRKLGQEIAERKRAEEGKLKAEAQLAQTQKIEALGRFAGGIAHDLNNVLYPIIINVEMLLEEAEPGTNQHEMLDQTLNAAYRQRDLVKQILSFSRQREQKLKQTKVIPLLRETLNFVRSTLPSTIEIRQTIDALDDTIMGDPAQIQQVIVNLFSNAADALAAQTGTIEVGLINTYLEPSQGQPEIKEGRYLQLTIRDTGYGMSSEVIDRIFEPFFTTKEVGKGSGMGLAVVHGILKVHGGHIHVESRPGKGSLFTVNIPVYNQEDKTQMPHIEKDTESEEKKNILLVDDEEIILSSLQRVLQRSGYRVAAVKDGLKALELFSQTPEKFDLIITDLTMPQITGVELAKRLIRIRPDIPIIMCTGFGDIIDEQQARAVGIRELLLKPAGTDELKTAISSAMSY